MSSQSAASREHWIAGLTPLRGVAALLVVVFHAPVFGIGFTALSVTDFFFNGWLWVDFFFLLSGFVLAHAYGERFSRWPGGAAFWEFLVLRFARLWPLHIVTLALLIALNVAKYPVDEPFTEMLPPPFADRDHPQWLPLHLLLLQTFTHDDYDTWNTPSWSISCEWIAYLLFPLLVRMMRGANSRLRAALMLACYLGLIAVWAGVGETLNRGHSWSGISRCLTEFTIGIGVYEFWRRGTGANFLASDAAFVALAAALALALHFDIWDFLMIPLMAMFIPAAAANRGRAGALLESRPLRWLGDISYSIYLVHWPVMVATALAVAAVLDTPVAQKPSMLQALFLLAVVLALTLGLSTLTYRWIERPSRRYLVQRLGGKPKTRPERAPAPTGRPMEEVTSRW